MRITDFEKKSKKVQKIGSMRITDFDKNQNNQKTTKKQGISAPL